METSIATKLASAKTRKAKAPKPETKVCIQTIDPKHGYYSARSSDGSTLYVVDLAHRTCTCPAGENLFANCKAGHGMCRHMIAARVVARGLASMSPADRVHAAKLCVWVNVSRVDLESLDAPLSQPTQVVPLPEPIVLADRKVAPAFIPAPADLMECFS